MSQTQQHAYAQATNAAFVPAPAASAIIVVTAMTITAEAAMKVTLSFGSPNQKVFEFATAGTISLGVMRWEGTRGAALGLTVSTGTADVSVDYVLEAA